MLLMKGALFMSREVKVIINKSGDKEILEFQFSTPIRIEMTSNDPKMIQNAFAAILRELLIDDFSLKFDKEGRSDLFANVAEKYIQHLNSEISTILPDIPKK